MTLLAQFLLLLVKLKILLGVPSHVDSSIEHNPIDFVIACFELPVHHNVRRRITVSDGVTCWQQLSLLSNVNTEVAVRLVLSAAVCGDATHKVV